MGEFPGLPNSDLEKRYQDLMRRMYEKPAQGGAAIAQEVLKVELEKELKRRGYSESQILDLYLPALPLPEPELTMSIEFARDMPTTAVEVLSPSLETISRLSISPGREVQVGVSSADSFIRLQLPSGRSIQLHHHGSLHYFLTRADLSLPLRASSVFWQAGPQTIGEVRDYHLARASDNLVNPSNTSLRYPNERVDVQVVPIYDMAVGVSPPGAIQDVRFEWSPWLTGTPSSDRRELSFAPPALEQPYQLHVTAQGAELYATFPGTLHAAYARVDEFGLGRRLVSVRASTGSETADTVGAYLAHGDYYAAETMAHWAEQSEDMLASKGQNPYAAMVGAYLLLRLDRFDLMRDWARNLANMFPLLADGCVIWAWQSLQQRKDLNEARDYFLRAVDIGLPVFTEGLRLLSDGLRLVGEPGIKPLAELTKRAGRVLWSSPFSARLQEERAQSDGPTTFEVGYISVA